MDGLRLFVVGLCIGVAGAVIAASGYRIGSTIGVCPALPAKIVLL